MLKSSACRSALYLAVLAANTGLVTTYTPHAIAAQGLEEVVVTARKREESVQEVPIAVSAFSADQLKDAGVSNIADLASQVPGMQMDQGGISQIWIRGVGQRSNYSYIDTPTGVYLDGIFLSRKEGQMLDLMDMESVQVLRGPQGTLFGKNTTAGALVMNTKKPTNEFSGSIDGRVGNYNRRDARLIVNLPLIDDKLLSKISIGQTKRDGYMTNRFDQVTPELLGKYGMDDPFLTSPALIGNGTGKKAGDEDRQAANLQLRWMPTENVIVDGFIYSAKTRETPPAVQSRMLTKSGFDGGFAGQTPNGFYPTLLWPGDKNAVWAFQNAYGVFPSGYESVSSIYAGSHKLAQDIAHGDYDFISNNLGTNDVDNLLTGVTVEWEINDNLSFKSITGYGKQRVLPGFGYKDGDGTPFIFAQYAPQKSSPRSQISQEFQFTGDAFDDRFHYSTGLFGMHEKINDNNTFTGMVNGLLVPTVTAWPIINPTTPPDLSDPTIYDPLAVGILTPATSYTDTYKLKNSTYAAYFQGSFDVTPHLQITGGLRWTAERRSDRFTHQGVDAQKFADALCKNPLVDVPLPGVSTCDIGSPVSNIFQFGNMVIPAAFPVDMSTFSLSDIQKLFPLKADGTFDYPMGEVQHLQQGKTWRKFSPMASVRYTLPDEWLEGSWLNSAMGYFTYSEGFKSGTFVQFGDRLKPIEPETIKNFEVGVKMDAFDHTARLNLAYFQMYYNNMQLIQVQSTGSGFPVVTYANASKSQINGVEFEFSWAPLPRLLLTAGGSYNDYKYNDFKDQAFAIGSLLSEDATLPEIDRSSERFPEVSNWTANVSAQYTFDTSIGTITPRLQYNYTSDVYMGLDAGAWRVKDEVTLPSYGLLNARVTYMSPDARWSASLYADNLTNKLYYQGTVGTGDTLGEFTTQPSPPRMYGLEFGYRFGAL